MPGGRAAGLRAASRYVAVVLLWVLGVGATLVIVGLLVNLAGGQTLPNLVGGSRTRIGVGVVGVLAMAAYACFGTRERVAFFESDYSDETLVEARRRQVKVGAIVALLLLSAGTIAPAASQDRTRYSQRDAQERRYIALSRRATELFPRRRDTPMREVNITDQEVGEIQAAALDVLPRAIVNIGAVTRGCACEDGAGCSDQVWVVATTGSRSTGLQLSRILGHWVIGPVQQWWLRYAEFLPQRERFKSYWEFELAHRKMLDSMPYCDLAKRETATGADRRTSPAR